MPSVLSTGSRRFVLCRHESRILRCAAVSIAVMLAMLLLAGSSRAGERRAQVVTFAQFNFVHAVAASMARVYFATTEGILRYNKLDRRWEEPLTGASALRDQEVVRLWVETFDERLYAQTELGLYEYDIFFDRWYPITTLPDLNLGYTHVEPPTDLLPVEGETYFGQGKFVDRVGRSYRITDIIADRSGDFWIATWGRGPARASTASRQLEFMPFGLIQNHVNTIFRDDSVLWVSGVVLGEPRTGLTGLNMLSLESIQIESGLDESLPADDINCLFADSSTLYIGTDHGLLIMDKAQRSVQARIGTREGLPGHRVVSLTRYRGDLYVGTSGGLAVLPADNDTLYHVYASEFDGWTIYDLEPVGKHLWIASSRGAYRYDPTSGKLQRYRDPGQTLFGRVYDIEATDGDLWLAADGGIVRLDTRTGEQRLLQDQATRLHRRAMAANGVLAAITSDRGVTVFFFDDDDELVQREFTVDDGLPSPDTYALELVGDFLWIGSDAGLTRLLWNDPRRVD